MAKRKPLPKGKKQQQKQPPKQKRQSGIRNLTFPEINWGEAIYGFIIATGITMFITYWIFQYMALLSIYGDQYNSDTIPLNVQWDIFLTNLPTILTISLVIGFGIGLLIGYPVERGRSHARAIWIDLKMVLMYM